MKVNHFIPFTVLTVLIFTGFACNSSKSSYNAINTFTEEQQTEFIGNIIRFAGHLPPNADHQIKFDTIFDDYYSQIAVRHKLEYILIKPSGEHLFLMTRPARSLFEKRVSIAGSVIYNDEGEVIHYQEIFRTWKLPSDELMEKSEKLFDKMVKGEDLTAYYPEFSGSEEYIEFPNKTTFFDTEKRIWVSSLYMPHLDFTNTGLDASQLEVNQ